MYISKEIHIKIIVYIIIELQSSIKTDTFNKTKPPTKLCPCTSNLAPIHLDPIRKYHKPKRSLTQDGWSSFFPVCRWPLFFCFFFISSPAFARPLQHKTNLSNFRILRTVTPLLSVPFDEGPGINSRDFDGIENIRRGGKLHENSAKRRRIVRVFRGL